VSDDLIIEKRREYGHNPVGPAKAAAPEKEERGNNPLPPPKPLGNNPLPPPPTEKPKT
jgi:hypothetical protein